MNRDQEDLSSLTPQGFMRGCGLVVAGWSVGIIVVLLAGKIGPHIGIDRDAALCFGAAFSFAGMAWFRVPAVLAGDWEARFVKANVGDDWSKALHMTLSLVLAAVGIWFLLR